MSIFLIVVWIIAGFLDYGLMYAFFSRRFPSIYQSRAYHIRMGILGPISLAGGIATLILENGVKHVFRYGFKL